MVSHTRDRLLYVGLCRTIARFLTKKALGRPKVSPCRLGSGQSDTGTGCSPCISLLFCQDYPISVVLELCHLSPMLHSLSNWQRCNVTHLRAAIHGLGPLPPIKNENKKVDNVRIPLWRVRVTTVATKTQKFIPLLQHSQKPRWRSIPCRLRASFIQQHSTSGHHLFNRKTSALIHI